MKEFVDRQLILNHKRKMRGFDFTEEFWDEAVLCEDIRNIPKADVQEIKHGEWIVCGDGKYVPFMCTACGKTTSWYHKQVADFCPRCGAKMSKVHFPL